jgi:preprotein translocase subunit YajC
MRAISWMARHSQSFNQKGRIMAEETSNAPGNSGNAGAPVLTQGETTSVGENSQTSQEQPSDEQAPQAPVSLWDNWFLYAVIIFWVWWLFGNKKRKAQKAQEKKDRSRREALQKGDNIITIGRMHGKVVAFTDDTVTLKPDPKDDFSITFDRQAVFRVLPRPGEEAEKEAAPEAK